MCAQLPSHPSLYVQANHVFDGIRCRVEKIIAKVAVLGLFHNGKCRLHYPALLATVKLSLHTAALWSRMHPQSPMFLLVGRSGPPLEAATADPPVPNPACGPRSSESLSRSSMCA